MCWQLCNSSIICLQEQRIHALQVRIGDSEQALAALEKTASERMEGLTQQSSTALDRLQRQLGQAYSQLEQLHALIKVLHCGTTRPIKAMIPHLILVNVVTLHNVVTCNFPDAHWCSNRTDGCGCNCEWVTCPLNISCPACSSQGFLFSASASMGLKVFYII